MKQADLLAKVLRFLAKQPELSASGFGRLAMNDPNLVSDLRLGRSPSIDNVEKILNFMKGYGK